MVENGIHIDINISKDKINQILTAFLNGKEHHTFTSESYDFTITKSSIEDICLHCASKSLMVELPVDFKFYKKAGLFSVDGEGKIYLNVEIEYNIDEQLNFSTNSKLLDYKWQKPPIIHLGSLNIPVEMLSHIIIHYMEQSVLNSLDKYIHDKVDLRSLIMKKWKQYADNYKIVNKPIVYFNGELKNIITGPLRSNKSQLHLDIWLDVGIRISDTPSMQEDNFQPRFIWKEKYESANNQKAVAEFSYEGLARMIKNELNGKELGGKTFDIESVFIRNDEKMEVTADIHEPVKGQLKISFIPVLDKESQKIDIQDLKTEVVAENIIYKLTSPLIEKIITSRLQSIFPLDISMYMDQFVKKIPTFQFFENNISLIPSMTKTKIENANFGTSSLIVDIILENTELDVVV
ncbi:MAG: DUF4403 family protein [Saprospiraceae bacterium]|nr:MAG: hypothetical protein UZ09_BCD002001366 [Bacteroidetes bacterium OLB9]MCO6462809.1 DUF4403 family protein [Saprospiraceae bacterium]MCZ2336730.1 DUF4403 family protein [Chitinophagales bacterium]